MPKAKPATRDAPPRALLVEKSPLLPLPKREGEDPFPPEGEKGCLIGRVRKKACMGVASRRVRWAFVLGF